MDRRIVFPQTPIQPLKTNTPSPAVSSGQKTGKNSFQDVLDEKLYGNVRFSRHAQERLQARNIRLSSEDVSKINKAVGQAREKGARDSLILMDDLALVVSVKNNTVVTAVDGNSLKENVFTNIDSAVIL